MEQKNLIMSCIFGSHLYGTSTPASDTDYKFVFIPNARDILRQRVQNSINTSRPKGEFEKNKSDDIDNEGFSLQKYLFLLAEGQTVALDMLFAPDSHILTPPHWIWTAIRKNKDKFLSKKAQSFVGYCRTQANKYGIRGSRFHAARKMVEWFDLMIAQHGHTIRLGEVAGTLENPTVYLQKYIDENQMLHTFIEEIPQKNRPLPILHLNCCNRKTPFFNNLKDSRAIYQRVFDEYGSRALLAEKNEGIDWKALSHAVRVGSEALELYTTGEIVFPLVNAPHLLDIKLGNLPYDVVAAEIEELLEKIEIEAVKSNLPEKPDTNFIDSFVEDVYLEAIEEFYELVGRGK